MSVPGHVVKRQTPANHRASFALHEKDQNGSEGTSDGVTKHAHICDSVPSGLEEAASASLSRFWTVSKDGTAGKESVCGWSRDDELFISSAGLE